MAPPTRSPRCCVAVPPGLIGHFDIHHMRSGVPIMAALSVGLFIVIAVVRLAHTSGQGSEDGVGGEGEKEGRRGRERGMRGDADENGVG